MNPFLLPTLLLIYSLHCSVPARGQVEPNVVIIFADDLGYGDLAGYGSGNATPNLDRLISEGMKFTNFYAQPQCSPSRAALMTGCYPQRVGIPWVVGPEGPAWTKDKHFIGLHSDEVTLPELLKQKNYRTACIGKWHLGHDARHLPTNHGFDYYFGLPYSNDMWPENSQEWPVLPLVEGKQTIEQNPDQRELTKRYTEKSIDFIRQNKNRPFFLYLAHTMPHVPLYASHAFDGKSGRGLYADVIAEIDWSVGEVLKTLKREGLEKNTLVIFTSDNGPWLRYGNHAGSAGGLREGKATTFEGGVRVPMIARWPGTIAASSTCHEISALFDLLPTIAELVEVPLPSRKIDGQSILPLLTGKSRMASREVHYYFQLDELQAVRKGKWKLHFPHRYEHVTRPGKDGVKGDVEARETTLALYDLSGDPGEQTNLSQQFPDVVAELSRLGERFRASMNAEKREPAK